MPDVSRRVSVGVAVATSMCTLVALGACGVHPRSRAPAAPPDGANAVVDHVIDGDTVHVELLTEGRASGRTESVRLVGVDTPETEDPRRPVQCFGREAAAFTARVLPRSTRVRLVRDVEARDRYGRLLAYVYRAGDGLFVNRVLVERGFARPLTIPPNVAHADTFDAAAATARHHQRGLWRRCADRARGPPAASRMVHMTYTNPSDSRCHPELHRCRFSSAAGGGNAGGHTS